MSLPFVMSVPHAGLLVPDWLRDRCLLSEDEIEKDGDEGAAEIYAPAASRVEVHVTTHVARAVLDMNRAEDDVRLDGVVKTHTCWNEPVWRSPLGPEDVERLLAEHHRPYHAALVRAASAGPRLGVDAHTMAAVGPPVGPDPGVQRPLACVSLADGTCPREWVEVLAQALREELGGEVRINDPFRGGFITRSHAAEMPWLQLELSRTDEVSCDVKGRAVLGSLERLAEFLGGRPGLASPP